MGFFCPLNSERSKNYTAPFGGDMKMYEQENPKMYPEEELVDLLLDFIIVSANLAKKMKRTVKFKERGNTINDSYARKSKTLRSSV